MKKIICFIILIQTLQFVNAQNSRAKVYVNSFDKQIEVANDALKLNRFKTAEGKISSLERSLVTIKNKDPEYDTSGLEKKLADLKVRCSANKTETLTTRSNNKEQHYANVKANVKLDDYVLSAYLPKKNAEELSKIDVKQLDMTKHRKRMVEMVETSIKRRRSDGYKDHIDKHRESVKNYYPGEAEKAYEHFLDEKRYFDYAVKFFPGEPVLEKVKKQFQSLFDELGDIEAIKKAAKENGVKKLANRRMPVAVINNPKIENLFKTAFNNESKDINWSRALLKINLTNRDWVIVKNKYTGVILGRKRYAAIAFKDNKTGECRLIQDFKIYQQYNGTGYSTLPKGSSMASTGILCENVNK